MYFLNKKKYPLTYIFFLRIGNDIYHRLLPLIVQAFDFFRINQMKFILKGDFSNVNNHIILMRENFDHEISNLKNKYGKYNSYSFVLDKYQFFFCSIYRV